MKFRHILLVVIVLLLVAGTVFLVQRHFRQVAEDFHKPLPGMQGDTRRSVPAKLALTGGQSLRDLRSSFRTEATETDYEPSHAIQPPYYKAYTLVRYDAPPGDLAAYLTRDPGDGKKHPAVVWAHGGFGSIDPDDLDPRPVGNDQGPDDFREAGFVVMYPSWRGENNNPGRFELYYGEADDLMAAVEYVRRLPYVDPDRIYLMGHSSGGTLVLLAVEMGVRVRAAFSFGGTPDMAPDLASSGGQFYRYKHVPFDWQNQGEVALRSPVNFVRDIRVPTEYIEGEAVTSNVRDARRLAEQAKATGAPLHVHIVPGADHFNVLLPAKRLVAQKLQADTGATFSGSVSDEELEQAVSTFRQAKPVPTDPPFARGTPGAARLLEGALGDAAEGAADDRPFVRVAVTPDGGAAWLIDRSYDVDDLECQSAGIRFVAARPVKQRLGQVEILGEAVDGHRSLVAQTVGPPTRGGATRESAGGLAVGGATIPLPGEGFRWARAGNVNPAGAQGGPEGEVYSATKAGSAARVVLTVGPATPGKEQDRANWTFGAYDGIVEAMPKQGYTDIQNSRLRIQAPFPDRIAFTILAKKDGKPVAERCVFVFGKRIFLFQAEAPTDSEARELTRCAEDLRESP